MSAMIMVQLITHSLRVKSGMKMSAMIVLLTR